MTTSCLLIQDISQFTVEIGGHTVTGWSEDADCLMMPDVNEMATIRRGGDGQLLGSFTNNIGGAVSIKLLPNSPSTAFFMQVVASLLQDGQRDKPVCWSGKVDNTSQGYSFTLEDGLMISAPLGQTAGKDEIATQVFTWEFHKIIPNYATSAFRNEDGKDPGILTNIQGRPVGGIKLPSQTGG